MTLTHPIVKDLVLVGGGHSHVAVLKGFGMRPITGARVTLISKDVATPYSGMLPGFIAGHYEFDDAHIDLRRLCNFANAAFYHTAVTGLDLKNQRVLCAHHPPVSFDLLSINTGSTPSVRGIRGALDYALPIKPIDRFLQGWEKVAQQVLEPGRKPLRVAVVGGGAGGVELTLAVWYRLRSLLTAHGGLPDKVEFHLLTDGGVILPTHNARVQAKFTRILSARGVIVHLSHGVVEVKPGALVCHPGGMVPCDVVLWVTSASAPAWIGQAGLQTDADGFLAVNDCLQSLSHSFVFGAGDVAAVANYPRPKSGVFAVRQGQPLTENLRRALLRQRLRRFKPQRNFLSLIGTGDRYAVASRSAWALEGRWVWRLKDWIDRRWMRKYQELPVMQSGPATPMTAGLADTEALQQISALAMRCGGCGAKVGSTILSRVLQRLKPVERDDILVGLNSLDDAAVIFIPPGHASVQTVDFFRSFVSDPYVFGRIAANHSLSDIFAMGATPQTALAIAMIPPGLEAKMEEQLYQMMAGAVEVLNEHNTALTGGHTAEGAELSFGLVVNGVVEPEHLMRKGGVRTSDQLILTKPLGTGTLFAAEMRRRAKGAWIEAALESMLLSNRDAAQCLLRHRATACTDVTGFGFLGHLVEMIERSPAVGVTVHLSAIPVLEGALETIRAGIFSSLQPQNLRLHRAIQNLEDASSHERYPILFDPQTAGGLLASVPASRARECVAELKQLGYRNAALIGEAMVRNEDAPPITIYDF